MQHQQLSRLWDIEDGMVAAGDRSLYPTAEIAADAAFKYYKL